tara:strand:+ start:15378 stop:16001 length:624 start_codon:yes stop_codon:yes gene_type:complete
MTNNDSSSVPMDLVFDMKTNGMSNNKIIEDLQRMGYNPTHIFDAVKLSDNNHANPSIPMNFENFNANMPPPPMPQQQQPQQQAFQQSFQQPVSSVGFGSVDKEEVEEVVETIIQEKWEDLLGDIKKIVKWKSEIESRFVKIEQEVKNIKDNFSSLQKAIFGKINDYDKSITDVGTEIKAMEKVFQKVLPDLTSNVTELSGIVKKMKK